jgi:23S rRNA pseudouridine1911/1915/1917 synthase
MRVLRESDGRAHVVTNNSGYEYTETVGTAGSGRSLLDHVSSRHRHSSRETWRSRILAGRVVVDGRAVEPDARLRPGQRIVWRRPPWREPDAPLAFAILFRDPHLLGVAKPAGLPTLPGGGFLEHTLLARVRRLDPQATPLHRLGRWTSGLTLFARTARARSALSRDWREARVHKRYRALARGRPDRSELRIEVPIGTVPYAPLGRLFAASPTGKPATTRVRVVEVRADCFLADVVIATGRPHQIRIHLAAAGYPLVGDPLYVVGGVPGAGSALPGDPGYHLHACELRLFHPQTGVATELGCRPPPILRARRGRAR